MVKIFDITCKYRGLCLMDSSHISLILIDHLINKSIWVWHVKPIWSLNLSCLTKGQSPLFNTSKFMVVIKLSIPNCWFCLENQLFKGTWLVKMHRYDTMKKTHVCHLVLNFKVKFIVFLNGEFHYVRYGQELKMVDKYGA